MQGENIDAVWQSITAHIKTYDNMDSSQIDAFFTRLQPQAFSEGYLMLTADTDFIRKWIESHYMQVIKQALEEIYRVPFTIQIEVDPTSKSPIVPAAAPAAPAPAPVAQPMQPTPVAAPAPIVQPSAPTPAEQVAPQPAASDGMFSVSTYSFDNFVRGTSNRMAYSMAIAVAETPGSNQLNPLFIYGKSGLGKTHLLRSIQNYVQGNYPHMRSVYVDTMELVNDYTDAAISNNPKAFTEFKQRYENADVLLIDDVQGLQGRKETLNMVFQIMNRMIDSGKQVVLSADRAPKNIDIDERYKSRFNMGGTCDIQPPELETKMGIIRKFIEECKMAGGANFDIPNDVQEYIAKNSSSNVRELKSAVTKVIFELRNGGCEEITIEEASRLLSDHFSGGAMKKLTIGEVQACVERFYNVSHSDLVGKKRSANITHARQIAIYLCRTMIDIPFKTIGTEFNRDHSTIMYSYRCVDEKVKESRPINEELELLRQMILDQ